MSAAPFNPDEVSPEVKQAGIAGLLGMMGMAVKIILTEDKLKLWQVILHLFVAMVVAILSGYALDEYLQNKKMLWAANGVSGFMAIKIAIWAERVVDAKLSAEESRLSRKPKQVGKPRSKKPNAKRKGKR
jgi:hypothetical protein